jgi:hypothetical protein
MKKSEIKKVSNEILVEELIDLSRKQKPDHGEKRIALENAVREEVIRRMK